jgi:hypothetical protein
MATIRPWANRRLLMKTPVLLSLVFLFVFVPGAVRTYAEDVERPIILQFMVGEMVISNDDPRISDGDYNLTLFGVAAQSHFMAKWHESALKQARCLIGRAMFVLMPPPVAVGEAPSPFQ